MGLRGLGQDDSGDDSIDTDTSLDYGDTSTIDTGLLTPIGTDTSLSAPTVSIPVVIPDPTTPTTAEVNAAVAAIDNNTNYPGLVATPAGYTGSPVLAANAATPTPPSGYQWATVVSAAGQQVAKILTVASGGSSVTLPNGTQLLYGSSENSASAALSSLTAATGLSSSTLLLIGAGVLVFFLVGGRK